jgi:hypothetical protein
MSETLQPNDEVKSRLQAIDDICNKLSDGAQEAAILLSVGASSGFNLDHVFGMGVSFEDFTEIIDSGIIRITTRQQVAREYVEANIEYINSLRTRSPYGLLYTSDETLAMNVFDREERVSNDEREVTWYVFPRDIFDYLQSHFTDDADEG